MAPGKGDGGMSIQAPLWLIPLAVLPPLVLLTVRELRRRTELLTPERAAVFLSLRSAAVLVPIRQKHDAR